MYDTNPNYEVTYFHIEAIEGKIKKQQVGLFTNNEMGIATSVAAVLGEMKPIQIEELTITIQYDYLEDDYIEEDEFDDVEDDDYGDEDYDGEDDWDDDEDYEDDDYYQDKYVVATYNEICGLKSFEVINLVGGFDFSLKWVEDVDGNGNDKWQYEIESPEYNNIDYLEMSPTHQFLAELPESLATVAIRFKEKDTIEISLRNNETEEVTILLVPLKVKRAAMYSILHPEESGLETPQYNWPEHIIKLENQPQ